MEKPASLDGAKRSLLKAAAVSHGHFHYESGHHGDLWLDLDTLFADARRVRVWASVLAEMAGQCRAEIVCGPLTGGAFLAQFLAAEIGADFAFAERFVPERGPVRYRVPESLRDMMAGRRVLLADDAVNAGSALLSTLTDIETCGGVPAGFATLLSLGDAASRIGKQTALPFLFLLSLERDIWPADDCPRCAAGVRLSDTGPATTMKRVGDQGR